MAKQRNYFFPQPAELNFKGMRFLITDRPHNANMENYISVSIVVESIVAQYPACFLYLSSRTSQRDSLHSAYII